MGGGCWFLLLTDRRQGPGAAAAVVLGVVGDGDLRQNVSKLLAGGGQNHLVSSELEIFTDQGHVTELSLVLD